MYMDVHLHINNCHTHKHTYTCTHGSHMHTCKNKTPPSPKLTFPFGHKFIIIVQFALTIPGKSQLVTGTSQKDFQIISKPLKARLLEIVPWRSWRSMFFMLSQQAEEGVTGRRPVVAPSVFVTLKPSHTVASLSTLLLWLGSWAVFAIKARDMMEAIWAKDVHPQDVW